MQEDEFLKFYLRKELEKIQGSQSQNLEPLLAYIGLYAIKKNDNKKIEEIDLKKIAGKIKSRFDLGMDIQRSQYQIPTIQSEPLERI